MRPLWRILIAAKQQMRGRELDCDECFMVLEYLAEAAIHGVDEDTLRDLVKDHLRHCPQCRKHHLAKLEQMVRKKGW